MVVESCSLQLVVLSLAVAVIPEAAMTELRKKGMASAGKRKAREASEGLLGLGEAGAGAGGPSSGPVRAALVEVNCETDFVARNDLFRHLVGILCALSAPRSTLDTHSMPLHTPLTALNLPCRGWQGRLRKDWGS